MRLFQCSCALALATSLLAACGNSTADSPGSDAAVADAESDAPLANCKGSPCGKGRVCVVTTAGGGACQQPDDAGLCPNGQPGTPGQCCNTVSTSYACQTLPAACNGTLACPCASSLCQCGSCQIADTDTLSCTCLYP
ncbi:MAG: hypothetical protein U0263_06630 [Polyangiaceae bacterium]